MLYMAIIFIIIFIILIISSSFVKKKQNFAWNNSSFEYDYREKCLLSL